MQQLELLILLDESDPDTGIQFPLNEGDNLIGQDPASCQVIYRRQNIKDKHAKIFIDHDEEEFTLESYSSENTQGVWKKRSNGEWLKLKTSMIYDLKIGQEFYLTQKFKCIFRERVVSVPQSETKKRQQQMELHKKQQELLQVPTNKKNFTKKNNIKGSQNNNLKPPSSTKSATKQLSERGNDDDEDDSEEDYDFGKKKQPSKEVSKKVKQQQQDGEDEDDSARKSQIKRPFKVPTLKKNEDKEVPKQKQQKKQISNNNSENLSKKAVKSNQSSVNLKRKRDKKKQEQQDEDDKMSVESDPEGKKDVKQKVFVKENKKKDPKKNNNKNKNQVEEEVIEEQKEDEEEEESKQVVEQKKPKKQLEIEDDEEEDDESEDKNQMVAEDEKQIKELQKSTKKLQITKKDNKKVAEKKPKKEEKKPKKVQKKLQEKINKKEKNKKKNRQNLDSDITDIEEDDEDEQKMNLNDDSNEDEDLKDSGDIVINLGDDKEDKKKGKKQEKQQKKPSRKIKIIQHDVIFSTYQPSDQETKKLKKIGIRVTEDIRKNFNIIVMAEYRRRLKLLTALNKKAQVVSEKWIHDCIDEGEILDTEQYILKPPKQIQQKYKFNYQQQQDKINSTNQVFEDFVFYIPPDEYFNGIDREEMYDLISAGGGQYLEEEPESLDEFSENEICVIILNKENKKDIKKFTQRKMPCADYEIILTSCLRQSCELEEYLF